MKKYLIMALLIFSMLALMACNGNGDTQDTVSTPDDIPSNANVSADSIPSPEAIGPQQQESRDAPDYITIRGERFSTALTELDLSGVGLTDEEIAPLRYMTNLRVLNLGETQFDRNQISDISSLAGLTNLEILILRDNLISDITPLAGLTNLTWLDLQSNQISDITALAGLTNLELLDLWNNQISDITPLAGLTNLHTLSLDFNQINDWSPVEHIDHVGGRP